MTYALAGLPQCRCRFKKFSSWRAFCGHHQQRACPVRFGTGTELGDAPSVQADIGSACGAFVPGADEQPAPHTPSVPVPVAECTPMSKRAPVIQAAVRADTAGLAERIRAEVVKGHCPLCHHCSVNNTYISRHACFMHPPVKSAEAAVRERAQGRSNVGKPCKWCQQNYTQSTQTHRKSCAVLFSSTAGCRNPTSSASLMADELIEQHVPSPPVPSSRASSLDPEGNLQAGSHKPPHPQEMDLSLRDKRATVSAPDSPQGTKPKFAKAEGKGTSLAGQNSPQQEIQRSQGSQDRTQRERDTHARGRRGGTARGGARTRGGARIPTT